MNHTAEAGLTFGERHFGHCFLEYDLLLMFIRSALSY
jgi:hypothetical protein